MAITHVAPQNYIFRRVVLIVDHSARTKEQTYFTNYCEFLLECIPQFIRNFVLCHTLGYCALIVTRDGEAHICTPLHISAAPVEAILRSEMQKPASGVQSICAAVNKALDLFPDAENTAMRNEILYFSASLVTGDGDDVESLLLRVKEKNVVCNIISFDCQMHVFSHLARVGMGSHYVPLDEAHVYRILKEIASNKPAVPTPVNVESHKSPDKVSIPLGFPIVEVTDPLVKSTMRFCVCHLTVPLHAFDCVRCGARLCAELPKHCPICDLLHISGAFVARIQIERGFIESGGVEEKNKESMPIKLQKKADSPSSLEYPEGLSEYDKMCDTVKAEHFCPVCNFPFTKKKTNNETGLIDENDLIDEYEKVSCGACGSKVCSSCADYIESFILISPCCSTRACFERAA